MLPLAGLAVGIHVGTPGDSAPASAQAPALDGYLDLDVICPIVSGAPVEMASVEVFTAGLAPMYADIDGYWLIRHQDDSEHWLYDGRHRVGPGGIWLTLDASTIGAGPPVCPATDDIVAFGWEVVNGVDTEYSRVGGQTLINRCDCCQHCLTPTATQTPIDCTTCPTPLPTSTGTPYTPTPTSTPIPTEAVVEACALDEGPDYLDWRVWYPLYVGQGPGQRALNWFSDAFQCVDEGFHGVSLWDYPDVPHGYPAVYDGECLDYYWFWNCKDAACQFDPSVPRLIVELLTISSDGRYLDRWGLGWMHSWYEIYFDPDKLPCACETNAIKNFFAEGGNAQWLTEARVPLRWFSYRKPGQSWDSPVVCTVRFNYAVMPDGNIDLSICNIKQAFREFVRVTPIEYSEDCTLLKSVNEYFQSDCPEIDQSACGHAGFCGDPRCARRGRAKRYAVPALTQTPTPTGGWSPTATATATAGPSPTPTPADCAVPGECGWCLNNPEVYITERMTELGRGSLASLSYAWRSCSSDDCRRFFIEDFAPGRRVVDPIRVYDCAAPRIDFVATPECPERCNECYDCGTPLPEGTPEACCPTDITPTPNLTKTAIPCRACPIVSGVPTTSGVCCGTSAPTPVPSPTTSTQYATTCPATAVGPTATRTPGPTRTWAPSCCSAVNEVVVTAVPTIPTPTPPVCGGFADTIDIQFDTAPFCGSGANRYSASLSVTVCCALAPCPPHSPEEVVGTWTAYNIFDSEVGSGDFTGVTDETVWFAETGCVFGTEPGDDRFPVRWVVTTSDPDLRLTLLDVTYHCCYSGNCCLGANCPPTATMTPSATLTRTPTPCGAPNC